MTRDSLRLMVRGAALYQTVQGAAGVWDGVWVP